MDGILQLITNPDQFIGLGNLLEVFSYVIRGDVGALSTADTSAVLSDGDGWSGLAAVLSGVVGSVSGS